MSKLTNNALNTLVENYAKKLHAEIHNPDLCRETAEMQEYKNLTETYNQAKIALDELQEKRQAFRKNLGITHYSLDPEVILKEFTDLQNNPRGWSVAKLKEEILASVALGSIKDASDLYNDLKKKLQV